MKTCEVCGQDEATTKMFYMGQEVSACENCAEREAEFMEMDEYDSLSEEY